MRWWFLASIVGVLLVFTACTAIQPDPEPEDLVPLTSLPAEYGELVTVLHYPGSDGSPLWDELWFENEETGTITRVPVFRPSWAYPPDRVRQIQRSGSMVSEEGR